MIKFKPENCIQCLCCMTIEECRPLINAIRYGEPKFNIDENKCKNCTKCIDICGKALYKTKNNIR